MADRITCACGKRFDWDTGMYPACMSCLGEYEEAVKTSSEAMKDYRAKRQVLVIDEGGARLVPASDARRTKPDSRSVVTTRPLTGRQRDLLRLAVNALRRQVRGDEGAASGVGLTEEEKARVASELRDLEGLI